MHRQVVLRSRLLRRCCDCVNRGAISTACHMSSSVFGRRVSLLSVRPAHVGAARYASAAHQGTTFDDDINSDNDQRDVVIRRLNAEGHLVLDVHRRPMRSPLKNIFSGVFVHEVLEFPEVLTKVQVEELNESLVRIGFMDDKWVSAPSVSELKEAGMFGAEVPHSLGGRSYTMTENLRLMEAAALTDQFLPLLAHNLVVQVLLRHGGEALQSRHLPELSCGHTTATFCVSEPTASSDLSGVQCVARSTTGVDGADTPSLLLNGTKLAVPAADSASLFLVVAHVQDRYQASSSDTLSVVLVDKNDEFVTVTPSTCAGYFDVVFRDAPVCATEIVGNIGAAHKVLLSGYSHSRAVLAAQTAELLRPLLNATLQYVINRQCFGRYLSDFSMPRLQLAKSLAELHALQSMAYTIASHHDMSLEPDYVLEAAVCQLQTVQTLQRVTDRCLALLGPLAYSREDETALLARRSGELATALSRHTGSTDIIKLFVALEGFQFAKEFHSKTVKIRRNPVDHPWEKLKHNMTLGLKSSDKHLYDANSFVHSSLGSEATCIEEMLSCFYKSVVTAMVDHGNDIMNQQAIMHWCADALTDIFLSCCSVARASRAYCIGLNNSHTEVFVTSGQVAHAMFRVRHSTDMILENSRLSAESMYLNASDRLVECGKLPLTHCLTRII